MRKITISIMITISALIISAGLVTGSSVIDAEYFLDQVPEPPIAEPGIPVNVTLGSPVAVAGNESVILVTPTGISINVVPSESVEITIDESSTNTLGAIPTGLLSIGIYLSIEMNETDVEVDATISLPYDDSMVEGLDENSLEFRFYNELTENWEAVPSSVDLENKIVYGNTTHFSSWTVTGTDQAGDHGPPQALPGVPFDITPGTPIAVVGNTSVELVTPNGISVSIIPGESVEITIEEFTENTAGALPSGKLSLGLYLSIEMNETDVDISATLSLPFTDADIANLDINSLEFRFYNELTQNWEAVPSTVDLENKVVLGNTDHFSLWTITGDEAIADGEIVEDTSAESALGINMLFLGVISLVAIVTIRKKK
ncbi:MAG: hypothetical protein GPJ54_08685 [Candidatus Heimdallarchaeota archaeon]|nr:hypothetical protein [Candidatus Heimdallarchaeota archaeon]